MSAGIDYNHPLYRRYEWVLFADDETVVDRATGYRSKRAATAAGYRRAAELLKNEAAK